MGRCAVGRPQGARAGRDGTTASTHVLPTAVSPSAVPRSIRHGRLGVPLGQTLFGKTVLVVGFGNIAKELAVR